MTFFTRLAAPALIAGAALLVFTAAAPATAATADDEILFFSNPSWTDVGEEDAQMIYGLESTGATVVTWDGGDGSAAAWAEALHGITVAVLPEDASYIYDPAGTSALSVEAAAVLKEWVEAGGVLLVGFALDAEPLFSFLTSVDFSAEWAYGGSGDWTLAVEAPGFPDVMPAADAADGLHLAPLTSEQLNVITPLYVNETDEDLGVGIFRAGDGTVVYLAFDWYWDAYSDDVESPVYQAEEIAAWNSLLGAIVDSLFPEPAEEAEPTLPDTGPADASLIASAGLLALLGGLALLAVRRKAAKS